jgi:hypothetical protein
MYRFHAQLGSKMQEFHAMEFGFIAKALYEYQAA